MDILVASAVLLRHCRTGHDLWANTIEADTQDLGDLRRFIADGWHPSPTTPSGVWRPMPNG